ncbi:hypothetical protein HPP92_014568 [Vanilla planifolia]|uniref:Uncharacterized protein n=1 Tax=Vanilla planifolia TaxID=51239 RepID=A0A835QKP5_VANPL|nr:hypothetical protein HPP92_014568 [Vanilla planifolia]
MEVKIRWKQRSLSARTALQQSCFKLMKPFSDDWLMSDTHPGGRRRWVQHSLSSGSRRMGAGRIPGEGFLQIRGELPATGWGASAGGATAAAKPSRRRNMVSRPAVAFIVEDCFLGIFDVSINGDKPFATCPVYLKVRPNCGAAAVWQACFEKSVL